MVLGDKTYEIVGTRLVNITHIFLKDSNPYKNIVGHGGTHLYIGSKKDAENDPVDFFDGLSHEKDNTQDSCIINLKDMGGEDEFIYFTTYIYDGELGGKEDYRFYIKSEAEVWSFLRGHLNPDIHTLSVVKLKRSENSKIFYFFKVLTDQYHEEIVVGDVKIAEDVDSFTFDREVIQRVRINQDQYRKEVLRDFSHTCVITGMSYAQILEASHIKPWKVSDSREKLNPINGLLMIGTCHKLFDLGLITISDKFELSVSPFMPLNELEKINVYPGVHLNVPNPKERSRFLEWHRENIFQS